MKIKHRNQSYPSNQCGQACVAMILNISVKRAVQLIKKRGSTQTKDLARALNQNGFYCEYRLTRISKNRQKPEFCILKLTFNNRHMGHWVLWNEETKMYHDPMFTVPLSERMYNGFLSINKIRITSFLEII